MKESLLIITNRNDCKESLRGILASDFEILFATNAPEAQKILSECVVDLIIIDAKDDAKKANTLFAQINDICTDMRFILLYISESELLDEEAVSNGILHNVLSMDNSKIFIATIRHILRHQALNTQLNGFINNVGHLSFDDFVTQNPSMQRAMQLSHDASKSEKTILITGESGVGKNLLSRTIHSNSRRSNAPFVTVECDKIPAKGFREYLFGSMRAGQGKFELAHQGTLYITEISLMNEKVQKLFHEFLTNTAIKREGQKHSRTVDVRIITSSSKDLALLMRRGTFRSDLYHLLHPAEIHLPALRERSEDIAPLSEFFLKKLNTKHGREIQNFYKSMSEAMTSYLWPGNVRQLKNLIERIVMISPDDRSISPHYLPAEILLSRKSVPGTTAKEQKLMDIVDAFEKEYVLRALQESKWNQSRAARALRIHRNTILQKIEKYNLMPNIRKRSL